MADMNRNITSANAKLVLTVHKTGTLLGGEGIENIFAPIELQQFATDASFSQGDTQITETRMGVDGVMVAGYTPAIKQVQISLEASSPSYAYLAMYWRAVEASRNPLWCTLVATIPSIAQVYTWTHGVLKQGTIVPAGKKILDPTTWTFDFEQLTIVGYDGIRKAAE